MHSNRGLSRRNCLETMSCSWGTELWVSTDVRHGGECICKILSNIAHKYFTISISNMNMPISDGLITHRTAHFTVLQTANSSYCYRNLSFHEFSPEFYACSSRYLNASKYMLPEARLMQLLVISVD